MSISRLWIIAILLTLLGGYAQAVQAADGAIKVKSVAEVEVTVVGKDGKKQIKRVSPDNAIPGTEVIFTNTFENISDKTASDIVINNPIPSGTEYKSGSTFGKETDIEFSADGGKKFAHAEALKRRDAQGQERTALASEYTNIRWTYKGQLSAGKSGEVGFRAVIK